MITTASVDRILSAIAPDVSVNRQALLCLARERPHTQAVAPLLVAPELDTVRAAILYIGVYGTFADCALLADCLFHGDPGVVRLAEYGLWSLWMQAGTADANQRLAQAILDIRDGKYQEAVARLTLLIADEPDFAEAHFQRGIALCLLERNDEGCQAYRAALRLNPFHFGAAASLGHASIEQGNIPAALHYYRRALRMHPRFENLAEVVRELEPRVRPRAAVRGDA